MSSPVSQSIILIPAFNPSLDLIELVKNLLKTGFTRIVVVDDGSTSKEAFEKLQAMPPLTVVTHPHNMGKGAALKTGFKYILKNFASTAKTIITVDADGQHLSEDVKAVANTSGQKLNQLILGVRRFDTDVPLRSAFGNNITRKVLGWLSDVKVQDTQTGLRAIPVSLAEQCCTISSNRYEFELESLLLASELGYQIEQVPITTVYIENNASSHFRPVLDSMRVYAVFLRYTSISILSFLIDIALFAAFFYTSSNIFYSTYTARTVSAITNFVGNKYLVFKSYEKKRVITEASGYLALVLFSATLSASILSALQNVLPINIVAAKIAVDIGLFFLNFLIQHHLLFPTHKAD